MTTFRKLAFAGPFILVFLFCSGCAVPARRQRLVSKPAMQFSRNPVFNYHSRLAPQLWPGLEVGDAQASVCTVCR